MTDFIAQDEEVRTIFFSKTTYSDAGEAVLLELLKDDRFEEANLCLEARYNNKERFPWHIEFEHILDEIEISDFTEELYQFADKWIEKIEDESEKKRSKERLNDWMELEKELQRRENDERN